MTLLNWLVNNLDALLVAALGALFTWVAVKVKGAMKPGYLRDVVGRAIGEVEDAVMEVYQTYAAAIKAASADGKLTKDEADAAASKALEIAKKNIGVAGLKRLARVLGLPIDALDSWLSSKAEAVLGRAKMAASLVPAVSGPLPSAPLQPTSSAE